MEFWSQRANKYNELKWVNDNEYLQYLLELVNPKGNELLLDIGTGTGKIAQYFQSHVSEVIGIDNNKDMLLKGDWNGISVLLNGMPNIYFKNDLFDIITARMVFHHIENPNNSIGICKDLLKDGGLLCIAESIPPSYDADVVNHWNLIRKLKEDRIFFNEGELASYCINLGFKEVNSYIYTIPHEKSSTRNWLESSGLDKNTQDIIFNLHANASPKFKEAHKMFEIEAIGDILCEHKHEIIIARK